MTTQSHVPSQAKTLGEAVRLLREERHLTLRALAQKVGISAPFLTDLEHDRRKTDRLDRFAEALDVPVEELRRLDARIPPDFKDWLLEQPELVACLKDYQRLRLTVPRAPIEALRASLKPG